MDIKVLRYFLRLCEGKSYAAVAAQAYVSKQAVSQSIQSLERTCGAPLFIRTSEGLVLTGEGEMLKKHAAVIVDQWDSAMAALHPASWIWWSPIHACPMSAILTFCFGEAGCTPSFAGKKSPMWKSRICVMRI